MLLVALTPPILPPARLPCKRGLPWQLPRPRECRLGLVRHRTLQLGAASYRKAAPVILPSSMNMVVGERDIQNVRERCIHEFGYSEMGSGAMPNNRLSIASTEPSSSHRSSTASGSGSASAIGGDKVDNNHRQAQPHSPHVRPHGGPRETGSIAGHGGGGTPAHGGGRRGAPLRRRCSAGQPGVERAAVQAARRRPTTSG